MNIFVTDSDPIKCALILDDLRLNKMILETCQLFAYALHNNGASTIDLPIRKDGTPYKVGGSHQKHPCTLWTGDTINNYVWLYEYFKALNMVREQRGFKVHACKQNKFIIHQGSLKIQPGSLEPFANCSNYKNIKDVHLAYRRTMIDKWDTDKRRPKWTNASLPDWYNKR